MAPMAARSCSQNRAKGLKCQKPGLLISIVDDDELTSPGGLGAREVVGIYRRRLCVRRRVFEFPPGPRTACLIADVMMPGMTGLELHRHLLASGKTIPTVLITAHPDDDVRERGLQDGIIGYLSKPFSEDDLMACIRSSLAV